MENYKEKYIKYKSKYLFAKIKQVGGDCREVCRQINKLTNIFIHGDCLDGLFTAYLLRKNCVPDVKKFSFIAPGLNIVKKINKIGNEEDHRIGLFDLSLPDPDQIPNKSCNNDILTINDKKVTHVVDHHFMTSKYQDLCRKVVNYDAAYSTSGTIWNEINNKKIDEQPDTEWTQQTQRDLSAQRLSAFVGVISSGDRGQLALNKDGKKFMLYIGLQKILDLFRNYKYSKSSYFKEKYSDRGIDPWIGFTNIIDYLVTSANMELIQVIGAIEIVSVYNFLNVGHQDSNFVTRKGNLYDKNNNVIDNHTLYVAKRGPSDSIIGQVIGITLKNTEFDPINYIIVYNKDKFMNVARFMVRDVSVNDDNKIDKNDNANTAAKKINPEDSGGHERASSVGIDANAWNNMIKVPEIDHNKKFKLATPEEDVIKNVLVNAWTTLGKTAFWKIFASAQFEGKTIYAICTDSINKTQYDNYINQLIESGLNYEFVGTSCGQSLTSPTQQVNPYQQNPQQMNPYSNPYQQQYGYQQVNPYQQNPYQMNPYSNPYQNPYQQQYGYQQQPLQYSR
uniref:Uncharacterized protein n=1 Tax=viral metagenome TaxID=1070528 RepID=A0A6C0CBP6_9ZZZZ